MKIAVVGYSRFGELWTHLMKDFGEVMVFNRTPKEVVSHPNVRFFNWQNLSAIKEADLIFLAVAISSTEPVIKNIKPHVKPGAVVMDVCSVKTLPCQWLKDNFDDEVEVMGTHPMFGPDSARGGLEGKQIVLCPVRISEDKLQTIRDMFNKFSLKIIETTPEDHDKQTAYSLALVHFLGRGLNRLNLEAVNISTLGFDNFKMIKNNVANDSRQLFEDMHRFNPYTAKVRDELVRHLIDLGQELRP